MKLTDIFGFAAILIAGYIIGSDHESGTYSTSDIAMVSVLLIVGFYFAVTLS